MKLMLTSTFRLSIPEVSPVYHRLINMVKRIILASGSEIRRSLLKGAKLDFDVVPASVDEASILQALVNENASPRDIADTLAEMKARKVSLKHNEELVIGCDQVLALGEKIFTKPNSSSEALSQLHELKGKTHALFSAAVIYDAGQPVWRHVGVARLTMKRPSDEYLSEYVDSNWNSIQHSVGAYKIEEEGIRFFSQISGDHFSVLGLPLLEVLSYLGLKGEIKT